VKIKDNNYNFIWTQLKNKKYVDQLKKHTEACMSDQIVATKTIENDLEGSRANESGEDTATTPSSSKRTKHKVLQDRMKNKKIAPVNKVKPPMQCDSTMMSNHLEYHIHLSNKKALYYNMKTYYESLDLNPFDYIPLTFHIKDGVDSEEFAKFTEEFKKIEETNEPDK
jgi:hypothetical protein